MEGKKKIQLTKKKGAPVGNEFWRLVKMPTGRPKKYTAIGLWRKAKQYFEWCGLNPLKEEKVFSSGAKRIVNKLRPMTETAFCLYAGISEDTFQRYKTHNDYKDFCGVSVTISKIIYTQKFEGAVADFFNANIIARDLGLKDKQLMEFDYENMPEEMMDKLIQAHINQAKKNAK